MFLLALCPLQSYEYALWRYYVEFAPADIVDLLNFFLAATLFSLPAIFGIVLWRVFVTNRGEPRGGVTILRLDDSSTTYSPLPESRLSKWPILLYLFAGALTFKVGVLAFETYQYVRDLFATWFG